MPLLDELQKRQFNLTRTFAGTYREQGTSGHGPSPLSPAGPNHFIAPWAWSEVAGGFEGKSSTWTVGTLIFARLKRFCKLAAERGVIISSWSSSAACTTMSAGGRRRCVRQQPAGRDWRGVSLSLFTVDGEPSVLERQKEWCGRSSTSFEINPTCTSRLSTSPVSGGWQRPSEEHRCVARSDYRGDRGGRGSFRPSNDT